MRRLPGFDHCCARDVEACGCHGECKWTASRGWEVSGTCFRFISFLLFFSCSFSIFLFSKSLTSLQGTENGDTAIQEAMAGLKAHAGFLSSAKALYPSVNDHLIKASQDYPGLHVVFAGHSAGGAVSSLLYTKCLLEAKKTCEFFAQPNLL